MKLGDFTNGVEVLVLRKKMKTGLGKKSSKKVRKIRYTASFSNAFFRDVIYLNCLHIWTNLTLRLIFLSCYSQTWQTNFIQNVPSQIPQWNRHISALYGNRNYVERTRSRVIKVLYISYCIFQNTLSLILEIIYIFRFKTEIMHSKKEECIKY